MQNAKLSCMRFCNSLRRNFSAIPSGAKAFPEWIQPWPSVSKSPNPRPPPPVPRNETVENMRRRILISCRKRYETINDRGILETDLLLSTYCAKYLDSMTHKEMLEFDALLNECDWDIFYWATGAYSLPDHIRNMSFFPKLMEHCKNKEKEILRMPNI